MYYGNIKPFSIENGPGVRVSLFLSGCRNHCRNCFSRHTWDFTYGMPFDEAAEEQVLAAMEPAFCAGLTVLGGEPMEPENQHDLLPFLRRVRERYPQKSIWIYTGFTAEYEAEEISRTEPLQDRLRKDQPGAGWVLTDEMQEGILRRRADTGELQEIMSLTDVLVDGRFVEEEKSLMLAFRGSANQRIIDVPETVARGKICLCEEWMKGTR